MSTMLAVSTTRTAPLAFHNTLRVVLIYIGLPIVLGRMPVEKT